MPESARELGPVDVDGDGSDDVTLWVSPGSSGSTILTAVEDRIIGGEQIDGLYGPDWPPVAVVDLDRDGNREVMLPGFGNTTRGVVVLSVTGCRFGALRITTPRAPVSASAADVFSLLVGVGGNSCAPTGCYVRNVCVDDGESIVIEHSVSEPVISPESASDPASLDPERTPIMVTTSRFRLENGHLVESDRAAITYETASELPAGAPSPSTSDVVDC